MNPLYPCCPRHLVQTCHFLLETRHNIRPIPFFPAAIIFCHLIAILMDDIFDKISGVEPIITVDFIDLTSQENAGEETPYFDIWHEGAGDDIRLCKMFD
jgi:hypothetical protein